MYVAGSKFSKKAVKNEDQSYKQQVSVLIPKNQHENFTEQNWEQHDGPAAVHSASITGEPAGSKNKFAVDTRDQRKVNIMLHSRVSDADYSLRQKREKAVKREMIKQKEERIK